MELVRPSFRVMNDMGVTERVEFAIRTAYQSFDKITDHSSVGLFRHCFKNRHLSVFEHLYLRLYFDRPNCFPETIIKAFKHQYLSSKISNNRGRVTLYGNLRCFMDIFYEEVHEVFSTLRPEDLVSDDPLYTRINMDEAKKLLEEVASKNSIITEFDFLFGNYKINSEETIKLDPKKWTFGYDEHLGVILICMELINSVFPVKTPDGKKEPIQIIQTTDYVNQIASQFYANRGQTSYIVDMDYYSFRIVADIGVGREWLRHVMRGVTQESTRYCNYHSKGCKIIYPEPFAYSSALEKAFDKKGRFRSGNLTKEEKQAILTYRALEYTCKKYEELIELGVPPQQARIVLPLGLSAPFVNTGHYLNWAHFCFMRDDKVHAHPQIYIFAQEIHDYFRRVLDPIRLAEFEEVASGRKLVSTCDFHKD